MKGPRTPKLDTPTRPSTEASWVEDPMASAAQAQRTSAARFVSRLRRSAARHRNKADAQERAARDRTRRSRPWHSWRAAGQRRAADADDERATYLSQNHE